MLPGRGNSSSLPVGKAEIRSPTSNSAGTPLGSRKKARAMHCSPEGCELQEIDIKNWELIGLLLINQMAEFMPGFIPALPR